MCAYACARYFELVSVSLSLYACIYAGELSIYPVDTNLEGLSVLLIACLSVRVLCYAFCVLVCIACLCAYAFASICTGVCVDVYVFCVLCASALCLCRVSVQTSLCCLCSVSERLWCLCCVYVRLHV